MYFHLKGTYFALSFYLLIQIIFQPGTKWFGLVQTLSDRTKKAFHNWFFLNTFQKIFVSVKTLLDQQNIFLQNIALFQEVYSDLIQILSNWDKVIRHGRAFDQQGLDGVSVVGGGGTVAPSLVRATSNTMISISRFRKRLSRSYLKANDAYDIR